MKVINFFGSPGVGKTTSTMELTSMLKKSQVDAEASLEVVKEYIHSNSEHLLSYQNYIFAQQERQIRIFKDSNEVEIAVTDAPLLHSAFYAPDTYPVFFKELVFEIFQGYENVNFFINRKHEYSHQGRIHDEDKSDLISRKLRAFLINHSIDFVEIDSTDNIKEKVFAHIMEHHRVPNYAATKKNRG
jgi:nicotinamide riboside kinase